MLRYSFAEKELNAGFYRTAIFSGLPACPLSKTLSRRISGSATNFFEGRR
jgi:hypothetical protein